MKKEKDNVMLITIYGRTDYRENTDELKKEIEDQLFKIGIHLGDIEIEN